MSFQDLESGGQRGSCASRTAKQWQPEESSCEKSIKANIQKMQEISRLANEQLERAQRSRISKHMAETINSTLEQRQDLVRETEQLFRDWTVHLAGEPRVRHMKKFACEKLEKAFKEELASLKDAGRRLVLLRKKAREAELSQEHQVFENQSFVTEERRPLVASARLEHAPTSEDDIDALSPANAIGLKAMPKSAVLASGARRQPTIVRRTSSQKLGSLEAKEVAERRRTQFERLCCFFAVSMILMYVAFAHHLHPRAATFINFARSTNEGHAPSLRPLILDQLNLVRMG